MKMAGLKLKLLSTTDNFNHPYPIAFKTNNYLKKDINTTNDVFH